LRTWTTRSRRSWCGCLQRCGSDWPDSLGVLEAWLLERYPTMDTILEDEKASHLDGAARYVGEVFRKAIGGHWRLRLNDPKYVFHGLPELWFLEEKGVFCECLTRSSKIQHHEARLLELPADPKDLEF